MKITVCSDNKVLLDSLSEYLKKITEDPDFVLLKTQVLILCRETFSEDYFHMKLSERNIPSLVYEIRSLKDFMRDILEKADPKTETAGRLEELFLLQKIISENKKFKGKFLPLSALFHIASDIYDIFEKYRKSGKPVPENWKYKDIWKEYRKKKTKPSPSERMLKFLESSSEKKIPPDFLSGYTHLFLVGHYHIDPVQKKFMEYLNSLLKAGKTEARHFICGSRNILIDSEQHQSAEAGYLLKEFAEAETEVSGSEKDSRVYFFSAPEVFRELETVGRRILKILHENREVPSFRLTDIKIIIPDSPAYHLGIKNVLESLNLSFSFTNNLFGKKLSPYYTAVSALLDLTESEFLPEKALSLFRNPCFAPSVSGSRIVPDIYAWQNILNSSRITGFLDEIERLEKGHRNDRRFTWEYLWDSLASQDIADSAETSDFLSNSEDFIMITSSLFHDLISLKNSESPEFFADLFEKILEIYLDPEMPESETDSMQLARMNVTVHDRIISSLSEIRNLQQFVSPEDRIPFEMYRQIISDTLDSMQEGSSQVYKSGITVGTVKDTLDAEVSWLFCTGLDEDGFRSRADLDSYISVNEDSAEEEKDIHLTKLRYLNHSFSYGAEEIYFSYTNYDTEKDRKRYPAPEYETVRTRLNSFYENEPFREYKISLYPHENYPSSFPETLSEKEVFDMSLLKIWESETDFNKVSPAWEGKELNLPDIFRESEDTVRKMFSRNSGKKLSKLEKRISATPSELANYIECPRKYVYTHIMDTDSDYEPEEENYSMNPLVRMNILNRVFQKFLKHPGLTLRNIEEDEELFSDLSLGLAGRAQKEKLLEYISNEMLPFLVQNFSESKVVFDIHSGSGDFQNEEKSLPKAQFLNLEISGRIPAAAAFYDTVRIGQTVYGKNVRTSQILQSLIWFWAAENSENIQKGILEIFNLEKGKIEPFIIHFPINDSPKIHIINTGEITENDIEPAVQNFINNIFPVYPVHGDSSRDIVCKFCPIVKTCFGYNYEFEPIDSDIKKNLDKLNNLLKKK